MYIWKEVDTIPDGGIWDSVSTNKVLPPIGQALTQMDYKHAGEIGDMAFLYPDDPQFSKPTRWFRYEVLASFDQKYTGGRPNCLSEITLYGRKAQKK
jgi:hypothetical protein